MDLIILAGTHMSGCTGLRQQILATADRLRDRGVHVPSFYDTSPLTWHNLAWEVGGDRRFDEARGTIDTAVAEAKAVGSRAVLLMSEEFETMAMDPEAVARIAEHAGRAGGVARIALAFRHQLSYLNLVYAIRAVNGLHGAWFEDFVRSPEPAGQFDYHDVVARFRQDPDLDTHAMSLQEVAAGGGLGIILDRVGFGIKRLKTPELNLESPPTTMKVLASLMAFRTVAGRGAAPRERETRQRVKAVGSALARRFPQAGPFWGWAPNLLAELTPQFDEANRRFAEYHGVVLEPDQLPARVEEMHVRAADPDVIRDLVDELRSIGARVADQPGSASTPS